MSQHGAAGAAEGIRPRALSAYEMPETPEEVSRRTFMANATLTIGGIVGIVLAIPIVGSLIPSGEGAKGTWTPLDPSEVKQLQTATSKPVKLTFTLRSKDGYLPEQTSDEYVWGIKVDESKFKAARPDLFTGKTAGVPYPAVNLGFVIFSPICPHLGCRFAWSADSNKFLCPCHGSEYTFEGAHVAGPAPRGLDPLPFREQSGLAAVTWIQYETNTPDRIVVSYQA